MRRPPTTRWSGTSSEPRRGRALAIIAVALGAGALQVADARPQQAGQPDARRRLRLPRSRQMPVPVPERLLHRRRPLDRHGPARAARRPSRCRGTRQGFAIDPTEWNRNDGFSPGSPILTFVPGLDLERTGAADRDRHRPIAAPRPPRSCCSTPTSGERVPYWAELDQQRHEPGPSGLSSCVRP